MNPSSENDGIGRLEAIPRGVPRLGSRSTATLQRGELPRTRPQITKQRPTVLRRFQQVHDRREQLRFPTGQHLRSGEFTRREVED